MWDSFATEIIEDRSVRTAAFATPGLTYGAGSVDIDPFLATEMGSYFDGG
jgi:hypothetical protein